ncbi:DNA primase [Porphyrobacter sp. CACIAM 03H1]|uniref:DNA primase n=1 Tax=Porphyrobacter sp. CACIAM 03H1 TaxID=2003315 RepID=UPI000B5A22BC|nr:DNA primase [Porphyrobacter sp. CACIAM 03H1]ASJ91239.1 DNA primase [Porphyrobacter sp. CACIAM 03H1]
MAITPQWKDELRARITLSTLVQRSVKLTRAGREWKGCCPFHDEKTPSFYVNDQKQFYHCFGCGAHGDAISWMVDHAGLQFLDAVKELAAMAGMEVPAPDPVQARKAEARASLIDVTEAAQRFFVDSLAGPGGAAARDYLERRGFSPAVMREFGFGWAPDDRQALPRALSQFGEDMLEGAGMRAASEQGERYDRFRGRVMLPIQDARGRVIAFGGRILDKRDGVAKYLNSPDTELFDKGRTLYNLHRAAPAARQSGRVVVVEGYMDVIALANAGIADVVAPLGTALTEMQLELLWRMVEVPVLCFDGDAAGQRAAMRAITRALPLLAPMRSLGIVRLPAGLDPDDLLKQQGKAAMERLLAEPASLIDTLWAFERDAQVLDTPEAKAGLKARLMAHVETIADPEIKGLYRRELSDRFSAFAYPPRPPRPALPPRAPAGQRGGWRGAPLPPPGLSEEARARLAAIMAGSQRQGLLSAVLAGFARHPQAIARHAEALSTLARSAPAAAADIESLFELAETLDSRAPVAICNAQGQPAPSADIRYAFLDEGTDPDAAREELAEAVSLLVERPALEAALAATIARFEDDPEGSFAEQTRLRAQLMAVEERLKAFGRRKAAAGPGTGDDAAPAADRD